MTVPRSPAPHHGGKGPRAARLDGNVERKVGEKALSWRKDVRRSSAGGNGHTRRRPSGRHKTQPPNGLVGALNGAKTEGWSRRVRKQIVERPVGARVGAKTLGRSRRLEKTPGQAQPINHSAGSPRKTSGQKTDPRTIRAAVLRSKSSSFRAARHTDEKKGAGKSHRPLRRWAMHDGQLVPLRGKRKFLRAQRRQAARRTSKWASWPNASARRPATTVGQRAPPNDTSNPSNLRGGAPAFEPKAGKVAGDDVARYQPSNAAVPLRWNAPMFRPAASVEEKEGAAKGLVGAPRGAKTEGRERLAPPLAEDKKAVLLKTATSAAVAPLPAGEVAEEETRRAAIDEEWWPSRQGTNECPPCWGPGWPRRQGTNECPPCGGPDDIAFRGWLSRQGTNECPPCWDPGWPRRQGTNECPPCGGPDDIAFQGWPSRQGTNECPPCWGPGWPRRQGTNECPP